VEQFITRRSLIAGLAATGGFAMTGTTSMAARRKPFFERIGKPIGLQLYTLGDYPAKDIDGVLTRVAGIGFRDLELPSLFGKKPADLKAAAARAGVSFSAIHLAAMQGMAGPGGLSMASETQRILDDLGALGIKDAVMPILLIPDTFRTAKGANFQEKITNALTEAGGDGYKRTADLLNQKAAALKPHGITVGYHNHNFEFAPIGKTTGWDVLMKELDPAVKIELDIGWVSAAGLDPVRFINKHKGRLRWMHVKDVKASTQANFALKMDPTEVGSGKLDWAKILPAARKAGVEHFYVEQEPPFSMARIDSAAKGFGFLKGLVA
jgi:sugar phosphate isomerase/epimerase